MEHIEIPAEGTPLFLALNAAIGEQRMLTLRQRMQGGDGMLGADSKRVNAWNSYGYKENLQFNDYYRMWERGGLAHGAIGRTVSKCWQDDPEIIEGDEQDSKRPPTAWEQAFKNFAKYYKLWERMREVDTRRLVGSYSGLILQIADGRKWTDPVRGRAAKRLVRFIPAWEGQLTVSEWDANETSETFGSPLMYSFQESNVQTASSSTGFGGRSVTIHPDRVIIFGSLTDGVPMLRAAYNDLVNIEKVLGGSGESFLKNASRQLSINFDKTVNLPDIATAHGVKPAELKSIFDKVTRGLNQGLDQTVITQGAQVTPLVASVPDPQQHFNIAVQSAAASFQMPVMIWIGSQTGERSSTQDQTDWNKTCQGRRKFLLASDIETVLEHLTRLTLIPPADTSVIWSDLSEATQAEKLDNAAKMADINQKSATTGEFPYSAQEIRDMSGHVNGAPVEVLTEEDPEELDAQPAITAQ